MSRRMNPTFRHRGFSLIELMIAMTLGLLIMTALVTLFVDVSRTNREMAKTNSQIENARFAMQILQDDLVHGGFWGGFIPEFDDLTAADIPGDAPSLSTSDLSALPCKAFASWTAADIDSLIGIPVQFFNAAAFCTGVVVNKQASTDVVVVRHADICVPGDANCEADVAGKLYFQASRCETDISGGTPYVLNTTGFTMQRRQCDGVIAPKRKFVSRIYYVRTYAVTVGDGIPTLVRSEFDVVGGTPAHQAAVPLIEGIQGFRIELGVDNLSDTGAAVDYTEAVEWTDPDNHDSPSNRGDGIPDVFSHCAGACSSAQLSNVSAARIYILARADTATPGYTDTKTYTLGGQTLGPFNDGFKRHVFSNTVRFVNITSRRETP